MDPAILKAFALAAVDDGGLGLSDAAADVWVGMWPERLCPAWKAMMGRQIRSWQAQAARLELQAKQTPASI